MQTTLKFICCSSYDFINDDGERVKGVKCQCYEPHSKKIVKVKTEKVVEVEFGEDILVDVVPNGNYLNYNIA